MSVWDWPAARNVRWLPGPVTFANPLLCAACEARALGVIAGLSARLEAVLFPVRESSGKWPACNLAELAVKRFARCLQLCAGHILPVAQLTCPQSFVEQGA